MGLGCVKTAGRLTAIEEVIRSRLALAVKLASAFNLENELKNAISSRISIFRVFTQPGSISTILAAGHPRPIYPQTSDMPLHCAN